MIIDGLLKGGAFEPEHCQAMELAFEGVLAELGLANRDDQLCERVAMKIIQLGQQGLHDPEQLRKLTLTALRV